MRVVFFCHAFTSCWNNGNAHFLRGVARELSHFGHQVMVYEPADGWSRVNALRDGGAEPLQESQRLLSSIDVKQYHGTPDLDEALHGADVVIVHEWNSPDLIRDIGRRRIHRAPFTLLFHDTHHRAVTAPDEISASSWTVSMACWRSARCCARSICGSAGPIARTPGTRLRTPGCIGRCRRSSQRTT